MLIYMYTSKTSDKSYIGKTIQEFEKRHKAHILNVKNNSQTHFHRAIRKYGIGDFIITILEDNINESILNDCEVKWIDYYDTFKNGYNMTTGGDGGNTRLAMSPERYEEYCENISKSGKGRKFTEEHKIKLSQSKLLNPTSLYGSDNGRAQKINIYNSKDEVMFQCHGNFEKTCKDNNLPYSHHY